MPPKPKRAVPEEVWVAVSTAGVPHLVASAADGFIRLYADETVHRYTLAAEPASSKSKKGRER